LSVSGSVVFKAAHEEYRANIAVHRKRRGAVARGEAA